jgi:hypothetical protein
MSWPANAIQGILAGTTARLARFAFMGLSMEEGSSHAPDH